MAKLTELFWQIFAKKNETRIVSCTKSRNLTKINIALLTKTSIRYVFKENYSSMYQIFGKINYDYNVVSVTSFSP
jgi:hypothetical protein